MILKFFVLVLVKLQKILLKKLKSKNINYKLSATSRNESGIRKFENKDYQSFKFNEQDYDENLIKDLKEAEYILISIAPKKGKDIVIKNFGDKFNNPKFKWITYLSATSVYGNHDGKWVDEKSETKTTSNSGTERLEAEKDWLRLHEQYNCPVQIFRLSGIYSNQYNILNRLKSGEAKIRNKKKSFFSRIHVEDIANVLYQSLDRLKKGEVYNISDDKPVFK